MAPSQLREKEALGRSWKHDEVGRKSGARVECMGSGYNWKGSKERIVEKRGTPVLYSGIREGTKHVVSPEMFTASKCKEPEFMCKGFMQKFWSSASWLTESMSSLMTRTEMVLETLVYTPLNQLTQLLAREHFVESSRRDGFKLYDTSHIVYRSAVWMYW
jgi:hypothetical protein